MRHAVIIAGLGAVGLRYDLAHSAATHVYTHARAFSLHPRFGPVVGVDPDDAARAVFSQTYGGPAFASLAQAVRALPPALVVIATPTDTHAQILSLTLAHCTPRAILCEKPLAYGLSEAAEMVSACAKREVALYVNYMRHSDPGVIAVAEMLERGVIEGPVNGVVWYSKGLIHNGSHFVALMRRWLGAVREVQLARAGRRWADRDPEPDFVLQHERGRVTYLAAAEECFSHYTAELVARNGRLRYEQGGERIEWQGVVDDPAFAGYRILAANAQPLPADMQHYQLRVVEQLAIALEGRPAALCAGAEGLAVLQDIDRIVELT